MSRHRPTAMQARPGADARMWVTLGVITELGWDAGGLFADVQFQPSGDIETCYVGMPYAGGGFGAYWPLELGDTVLVAIPNGDSGYGPVIISRFWNSGDPPPSASDLDWASGAADLEPPKDAVIRLKPGVKYKLRSNGADIDMRVETSGDFIIENTGTGKVKLGLAETALPIAIAKLVEAAVKAAVELAIAGHTHLTAGTGSPSPGIAVAGGGPYIATVSSTAATKTEAS